MTTDTMLPGMISGVMITVTIFGKTTTGIASDKIFAAKRDPTWFLQILLKNEAAPRALAPISRTLRGHLGIEWLVRPFFLRNVSGMPPIKFFL
jgi:hypothetical protein